MIRAGIITVSDCSSQGIREDSNGPAPAAMLADEELDVCKSLIIPDENSEINDTIIKFADKKNLI
jgi:molybdopterin biosynthesis enzyme MoaB